MITKESAMRMSTQSLLYNRRDLTEAIEAASTLRHAPKLSQYQDELLIVAAELHRREHGGSARKGRVGARKVDASYGRRGRR